MRNTFLIVFVFALVNYTHSQFLTIGSTRKTSKTICDTSAKSSLVEHFFNIIFTEFYNTPPVCVCVQMCPDQPTYCYPNGCLQRAEKNMKAKVPLSVGKINENTKPIFFIDETNDFMHDFLTKNYIDDNIPIVAPMPTQSENSMTTNMRPDPFKDRYKIIFKNKKMPKLEFKYNLGEQVKNMKSELLKTENVDVSNTRWPMNKFDRRLGVGQRSGQNTSQKSTTNPRYFMSLFPDKETNYPPKYFKRELPNNTNSEVDIKAIYVVGKSATESSAFSLEKLIDSLIESSFDKNVTPPDSGAETKILVNQTIVQIEHVNATHKDNSTKRSMNNETTNIISMNLTNENVDKNKYSDGITNNLNNVGDMIATLSRKIERQNNTSLEIMKRITGDFRFESFITTSEKPIGTSIYTENETSTTEYATLPVVYEPRTTRKIRKRVVRRLQYSKYN